MGTLAYLDSIMLEYNNNSNDGGVGINDVW